MKEKLLLKLGEETLYSAKGHFKSSDLRRHLLTYTIWLCVIINILSLANFSNDINKYMGFISLFATIALLIWNQGEGKNYRAKHKSTGEQYLVLHKEVRDLYFLKGYTDSDIKKLSDKVKKVDKSTKPDINSLARKWAQKAIQKGKETDNWFKL